MSAISLNYKESERKDKYGNILKLRSTATIVGGKAIDVVDVYFTMSGARQKGPK